jgi:5-methylthioadenosine/S-adenosylhomocysteine deaminase
MATLGGARAVGMEDDIGSLMVGKRADVVVFDARRPHLVPHVDPMGNLVHTGQGRDVTMVVVDGEILVEGGRPTRVDMDEVCREGEQAARELWAGVGRRYWQQRDENGRKAVLPANAALARGASTSSRVVT